MVENIEQIREKAIEIAQEAGGYLLSNFRKDISLYTQRGLSKEVTTKYDIESDRIIVEAIKKAFPTHSIIAEESGEHEGLDTESSEGDESNYVWIVDSMDGSGNFANGNPFFSVSIGIMKDSETVIGVVYAPYLNELYVATKGDGSYLNGEKLNVSSVKSIDKSYVVACEGGSKTNERMTKLFNAIYPDVKDMRKIGSAALECGAVATGRAEAFTTLSIAPWDVAAGILIVEEAGGKVSTFAGDEWVVEDCDLVCSNELVHSEILNRIKEI